MKTENVHTKHTNILHTHKELRTVCSHIVRVSSGQEATLMEEEGTFAGCSERGWAEPADDLVFLFWDRLCLVDFEPSPRPGGGT